MVSIRLFLRLLQLRYHLPAQAVLEGRQGDFGNVSNRLPPQMGLRFEYLFIDDYNYDEATVGLYYNFFEEISVESPSN